MEGETRGVPHSNGPLSVCHLTSMIALMLAVLKVVTSLFYDDESIEYGPYFCIVRPVRRCPSSSATTLTRSPIPSDSESELDGLLDYESDSEVESEVDFNWRYHSGGSWNGWNSFED